MICIVMLKVHLLDHGRRYFRLSKKDKLPSKFEIAKYWNRLLENNPIYQKSPTDIGEPACFACGWYNSKWEKEIIKKWESKNKKQLISWDERDENVWLNRIWENSKLERAHIISEESGGKPIVSNLVLLCEECHITAPMTTIPKHMYDFINTRKYWKTINLERFESDLNEHVNKEYIYNLLQKTKRPSKLIKQMKIKYDELKCTNHAGQGINNSTILAVLSEIDIK